MKLVPNSRAKVIPVHATAAANTAVVITLAANAQETWNLLSMSAGYSATPTAGMLRVEIGGTKVFEIDVVDTNPVHFEFDAGLFGRKNQVMVITLTAAGGGVIGKLNVTYQ